MVNVVVTECKKEMPLEDYFFSNTYPVFRKLQEIRYPGEPLCDCINDIVLTLGSQKTFYEMSRGESQKYFSKELAEFSYGRLGERIKTLFLTSERIVLEESENGLVQLLEAHCSGYCYAFLVDRHFGKNVVILTDFYTPQKRIKEKLLLSTLHGKSYVEENLEKHYRHYRNHQFVVINTYHAFCQYAKHKNHEVNLDFNNILFPDALKELDDLFSQGGDLNDFQSWQHFSFVVFKNVIIVYRFDKQTYRVTKVEAV